MFSRCKYSETNNGYKRATGGEDVEIGILSPDRIGTLQSPFLTVPGATGRDSDCEGAARRDVMRVRREAQRQRHGQPFTNWHDEPGSWLIRSVIRSIARKKRPRFRSLFTTYAAGNSQMVYFPAAFAVVSIQQDPETPTYAGKSLDLPT
jgi:hypothetical protein